MACKTHKKLQKIGVDRRGKSVHNEKTINACSGRNDSFVFCLPELRVRTPGNISRIGSEVSEMVNERSGGGLYVR